jgi:L-2-hydroxyglutarate oxidase LhgO
MDRSVTIIGGGAVGCAVANELADLGKEIYVLERNQGISQGENQSSRNSGVIHAGPYYDKAIMPLKAEMCPEGNTAMYEFCPKHNVSYVKTEKYVVACNEIEDEYLQDLERTSEENGVEFRRVDGEEVAKREPNVKCYSALHFPSSGIVEPTQFVKALYVEARNKGVSFLPRTEVLDINPVSGGFEITILSDGEEDTFETETIVNSAGLYADKIAKMVNPDSPYEVEAIKGEWAQYYRSTIDVGNMNIYPAPYGVLPDGTRAEVTFKEFNELWKQGKLTKTLGVHITPTFDQNTGIIGPSAVRVEDLEDYRPELALEYFFERVKGFAPGFKLEHLQLYQSGIQAKIKGQKDFIIEKEGNLINLLGICSPGLTCSIPIARKVKEMVLEGVVDATTHNY